MLYRGLVTLYLTQPPELDIDLLLEDEWTPYGLMGKSEWSLGAIGKSKKEDDVQWKIFELTFSVLCLQVDTIWA
jgi:hypothetical protein